MASAYIFSAIVKHQGGSFRFSTSLDKRAVRQLDSPFTKTDVGSNQDSIGSKTPCLAQNIPPTHLSLAHPLVHLSPLCLPTAECFVPVHFLDASTYPTPPRCLFNQARFKYRAIFFLELLTDNVVTTSEPCTINYLAVSKRGSN